MKRFLEIVLIALSLLFVINMILDFYVSYRLRHCQGVLYNTWNKIERGEIDADLLIMGNSRAEWHYDPLILDSMLDVNSFIIGISGSGLNRQIMKYNIYDHYTKVKPNWLIINVDYFATCMTATGFERYQFFPYFTNPYMREQILAVDSFSVMEKYIPIYRYTTYKGIYTLLTEDAKVIDKTIKGYSPYDMQWDPTEYNRIDTFRFEKDEFTVKLLDDFILERKNEGVQVIFCYAPIYIGLTQKVTNLQEMYDTYQYYVDKYEIPVLDYTYSYISMDTANFFNATHLNIHGSEIFSMQLAHDIDSLKILK